MTQLNTSAAYVRKSVSRPHIRAFWKHQPDPLDAQLLDLLKTPHTVESLTRVVANEDEQALPHAQLSREISVSMRRLLEGDLIELSPDS